MDNPGEAWFWSLDLVDAVERLLSDLVAIPSVNPMGRPLSGPEFLEASMTAYLDGYLSGVGVRFERRVIAPGRENILAYYDAPDARRTLLFDAHQDTVPVDGMTIPPFTPRREGGRLYGRGSCDVKGGMTAMLLALQRLVKERPAGSASVVLACTVDEEFTHIGSSALAADRLAVDLAVVAEPTRLDVVVTHKGTVRWKVRTHGVACHSSTPKLGRNAIYRMAAVIRCLEAHADELANAPSVPMLGPPSLSVGRIEGGQSVNVVPDWCEIEIDRRVVPGEVSLDCPQQVLDRLKSALGDLEGIEFLPPWINMPALLPRVAEADLDAIRAAVRAVIGRDPETGGVPYGTDAGPLGATGIPCLVYGPGDIAQAHTKDEWIEIDQVRAAAEVYYGMAKALGRP